MSDEITIGDTPVASKTSLWARLAPQLSVISSVGSSFAVFGLQAFHAIFLAKLLGLTGRGEYGIAMFLTQTMLYIGLAGTLYSIARRAGQPTSDFAPLQRSALRVGLITGFCSLAIVVVLAWLTVASDKRHLIPLCVICALMLPIEHMRLTSLAVDHGRGKYTRYNISRVFAAAIFPAIVLAFYFTNMDTLWIIAWVTVVVPAIGFGLHYALNDRHSIRGKAAPSPLVLIGEGRSYGVAVLAGDLFDRLGHIVLFLIYSVEGYGMYVTALPAASLMLVAPHTFALYAFRAADSKRKTTAMQLLRYAGLVLLAQAVCLAGLLVLLNPVLLFLFGPAFDGIGPVAQVLLFAMAFNGCGLVGDGYLRGCEKASYGVWSRFVAAVVMFIAVWLIPEPNFLVRVAWAMTVGYAVNSAITLAFCMREASHRHDLVPTAETGS